jgi:hypothetical protein
VHTYNQFHNALATLLGSDLNPLVVCLDYKSSNPSAATMKMLLQAISDTETRDPRDSSAVATKLLNLCFSPCRESSISLFLGLIAALKASSGPQIFSRFCTDPVMALLWQHANSTPRECSDAAISFLDHGIMRDIFGRNITTCVLRSLMPSYVALCDKKTILCEEAMLAIPSAEIQPFKDMFESDRPCTPQLSALANTFASGNKCFERLWSVQEAIAYVANQTCLDSGMFMYSFRLRTHSAMLFRGKTK